MKENGKGLFEEYTSNVDGVTMTAVKWHNNKAVHLLNTFISVYPTANVQHWEKFRKERINIRCPSVIVQDKKFMGGVNLLDSLITLYRILIRSRKWYHWIVFHLLDMTIVNGWLLYRRDCASCDIHKKQQYSLLDFEASIAACLCQQNKRTPEKKGRPSSTAENQIEEKKAHGSSTHIRCED
jgi:hypothetical protein